MVFLFQFIYHRHCIIFYGNETLSLFIYNQIIFSQTELTRAQFGELQQAILDISPKVLTVTLRTLE